MGFDPKQAKIEKDFAADAPLICCRFDARGRFIFAGAEDRNLYRFDLASGAKTVLSGHGSWVNAIASTPDGETMISAGCDDSLMWWATITEKPEPVRKVHAHEGWVRAVAVSPDGTLVASGGNDRILRLWRTGDATAVRECPGHERDIYSIVFTHDGAMVLSGDLDGKIHQWEVATGIKVRTLEAPSLHTYEGGQQVHYGGIRGLAVSADSQWVAAGGLTKATNPLGNVQEPQAVRFGWSDGKLTKTHATEGFANNTLWGLTFHPEGMLIGCVGGNGGHLVFWGPEDEKPAHKFALPNSARGLALDPVSRRIATVHHDRRVRLVAFG
jgi:WD40 repeat protein